MQDYHLLVTVTLSNLFCNMTPVAKKKKKKKKKHMEGFTEEEDMECLEEPE